MIIIRSELELPRQYQDMDEICQRVFNDRENFPDKDYRKRKGIVKDILEEYWPLRKLVEFLGNDSMGYLSPQSHKGPDAVVSNNDGKHTVQITCGNQSYKEALNREMLSHKMIVLSDQEKERDKKKKKIIGKGRALTTIEGKLRKQVQEVEKAIKRKIENFHEGTDFLLVDTDIRLSDTELQYSWQDALRGRVLKLEYMLYKCIFIIHKHGVYPVKIA